MRVLGRLILLLLFFAGAVVLYPPLRGLFQVPPPAPSLVQQLDLKARASTVYFLAEKDWTTFPVINQTARIRILTHAGVDPETQRQKPLRYGLQYQLLNDQQEVLKEGDYTHETQLPLPQYKRGVAFDPNVYTDRDLAVASGQFINLQVEGLPQAAYLRLRLKPLKEPLMNIAVRVYYEERMNERRASVTWERLNQKQKENLAEGIIYPPELLSRQERLNLLERQWQPIGPLGAEPNQGILFNLQGGLPARASEPQLRMPGLYAAPDRPLVLPVPASGQYRIQFTPLFEGASPLQLELKNVTETFQEPLLNTLPLTGKPASLHHEFSQGLLVVTPTQPGMLDGWALSQEKPTSLLPEPSYLRTWLVQAGLPLQYQLVQGAGVAAALKIDLRAYGEGRVLAKENPLQVHYRLLDAQGRSIDQGRLEAIAPLTLFDRIATAPQVPDLSEPASFFLRLPPDAVRLELSSEQKLLANAYTRPRDLPHRTRVPQDYYPWRGEEPAQPGWFILQPMNEPGRSLPSQGATSRLLHLQSRPLDRNAELLSGRYQWQSLDPQRSARGARMLMPLEGEESLRPRGLPAYYQPLEPGSQTVEIASPGVTRQLKPQLIYLREQSGPFKMRLAMGGERIQQELIGRRGQIDLPPIVPRRHRVDLAVNTQGIWLMNYRYPDQKGYILRMGFRLEKEPLRYQVQKRSGDSQIIGARFYSLGEKGAQSQIQVRLLPGPIGAKPTREWTHLERLYQIEPPAEASGVGYVLDHQYERVAHGQSLFLDLGSDLPEGLIQVDFSLLGGAPGYLIFHEILPGEHERTRSFREEQE